MWIGCTHYKKLNGHEGTLRKFLTSEDLENLQAAGLGEEEQARYKYVVNIQNNGFADRMWRILALKVVVLQEMHAFREFFLRHAHSLGTLRAD